MFDTCGNRPRKITDLRTGEEVPFKMWAGPFIEKLDWDDVGALGAKVLKFEF